MVETTQSLLGADGRSPLPAFLDACAGRCRGAHFGTYDFTASCNITAAYQTMDHPWCDLAKGMMMLAYGGTGLFLSDGATNVMPVGPHRGDALTAAETEQNRAVVHAAWRLAHRHIRRSLEGGFYQGWDLHPGQLPVRYATCFAFFLEGFAPAAERLRNFVEKAAQATLVGDVFDDAATGQGLLNYFLRALNSGAIDARRSGRDGPHAGRGGAAVVREDPGGPARAPARRLSRLGEVTRTRPGGNGTRGSGVVGLSGGMTASLNVAPGLSLQPLEGGGDDVDFGVDAGQLDLDDLDDAGFAALERAVLTHAVVVVRGQERLSPRAQFELTRRFDPTVKTYGHGNRPDIMKQSVLVQDLVSIPAWPQVKLLGNARVSDHEGLPEVELHHPSHRAFHLNPLTDEQEAQGLTRFYRWHIDAALYELHPPKVTTLLALKVPAARAQTVVYDDGSGDTLDVSLGTTAFVSGVKAFELLSPPQRRWACKTQARYAPHPYVWMRNARARSNGLGLVSEGRELPRDQLPPYEESKVTTLAAGLEEPADGPAGPAASRLLRRGPDRRRQGRSATSRPAARCCTTSCARRSRRRACTPTPGATAIW